MHSRLELDILDACADDEETFYFVFAGVNFGGQVFTGSPTRGSLSIRTPASEIVLAIRGMMKKGWLTVYRVGGGDRDEVADSTDDFSSYDSYECVTFDEHLARFGGYGPHVFALTDRGRRELNEGIRAAENEKTAQPGATDNPDDAQRVREDH